MKNFTNEQGEKLLQLARAAVDNKLSGNDGVCMVDDPLFSKKRGTFVTLKLHNQLRGCIGNIEPVKSVRDSIMDNAVGAAFHDHRFSPVSIEEFSEIHIGISILTRAKPLLYSDEEDLLTKLQPHRDGVVLRRGRAGATFLPHVWEQLPETEQFLSQLCLKAGLPAASWRDSGVELEVYQVQNFEEERK